MIERALRGAALLRVAVVLLATVSFAWSAPAIAQPSAACDYIAQAANDGRLDSIRRPSVPPNPGVPAAAALGDVTYGERFDLNGDGRDEYVYVVSQGTAHVESLFVYDSNLQPLDYSIPPDDYLLHDVILVTYEDVHYVVAKNDDRLRYAATVSAEGTPAVVCGFEQRPGPAARIVESLDDRVCTLALNGTLDYAIFDRLHAFEVERSTGPGRATAGEFAASVDFDNDGDDDWVVEVGFFSGAGPGCGYTSLAALDDTRSERAGSSTAELLESIGGRCTGSRLRPFRFEGEVYVEDKYSPGFPQDYYIRKIDAGSVSTICRIGARPINYVLGR
jgi:hypothetical protein